MAPAVLSTNAPSPVATAVDARHAEAAETLTRILGAIEEYVYTGEFLPDGGYRVVFAGPCRERFLGMTAEDARDAVWAHHVHPADVERFHTAHEDAHTSGRLDVEYRMVGADGTTRWVRDRGRMRAQDGRRFLDGSVLDVTEIRSAQEALEAARTAAQHASEVDPLTGVYNRRTLLPLLHDLRERALGVVCLDLDHFKVINDLHGHAAGDAVLVAVARRLRDAVRESDAVFRTGGEEFLLVLPDIADELALRDIAEAVRRGLAARPIPFEDRAVEVTVSVGAAHATAPGEAVEQLLSAADRAMYAAKRAGRNRVRLASALVDDDAGMPDGGAALRLAEAMAAVAALHGGERPEAAAERATIAAHVARRLGGAPPQVLRCRLAALLLRVGEGRGPEARDALLGAAPELRGVLPIVREALDGAAGTQHGVDARIVAAADTWVALRAGVMDRAVRTVDAAGIDPPVAAALRAVLVA